MLEVLPCRSRIDPHASPEPPALRYVPPGQEPRGVPSWSFSARSPNGRREFGRPSERPGRRGRVAGRHGPSSLGSRRLGSLRSASCSMTSRGRDGGRRPRSRSPRSRSGPRPSLPDRIGTACCASAARTATTRWTPRAGCRSSRTLARSAPAPRSCSRRYCGGAAAIVAIRSRDLTAAPGVPKLLGVLAPTGTGTDGDGATAIGRSVRSPRRATRPEKTPEPPEERGRASAVSRQPSGNSGGQRPPVPATMTP